MRVQGHKISTARCAASADATPKPTCHAKLPNTSGKPYNAVDPTCISVPGRPPARGVNGSLVAFDEETLDPAVVRDLIIDTLSEAQRATLEEDLELDYALQVEGVGRFRGNVHIARGNTEAAFRFITEGDPGVGKPRASPRHP